MSDEQQEVEQEEEEEDEENQQDEDQQGDQDQDQEDEDQDQDGDEDQDQQGDQQDQQDQQEQQQEEKPVPSFKPVSQQFVFRNLLAEIASIGNSVDHFINTLPSRGGTGYRSYQPRIQYDTYKTRPIQPPVQQKKYTIMKDEDIQVSMQPQIIIQQTLTPKQQPKKQPYKISNESTKFLAQLYEQNKKLKRWQNSQTGPYATTNSWNKSKEKFERPEHQRGLINLDDRNKQIDQAIEMLRRQQYE